MKIAIVRERTEGETRVAATPETVTRFLALGAEVTLESGAGTLARFPDADYQTAGATIAPTAEAALKGADIVLTVRRPDAKLFGGVAKGALVVGGMDPYGNEAQIEALAKTGVTVIAMEFMPRITRAQVMDILSSQANLAGYQAVIDAAVNFDRAFPMMMTAAGTVRPAKAFVMGAGVAGLQAIATAKRLGAIVSANDVRPAAKEQVESLGGKFIAVEDDEFKQAETAAGYAKPMSAEYQAKQAALTATHIAKQDIVITTALIPGRPAPKLITKAMVESMAPGSVIVDLAAERGGNVELTEPGKVVVTPNGVTIIGYTNVPGRLATSASQLFSRNLYAFIETLFDKKTKAFAVNWDDELVKATLLTRDGAVVHANLLAAVAALAPASPTKAAVSTQPAPVAARPPSNPLPPRSPRPRLRRRSPPHPRRCRQRLQTPPSPSTPNRCRLRSSPRRSRPARSARPEAHPSRPRPRKSVPRRSSLPPKPFPRWPSPPQRQRLRLRRRRQPNRKRRRSPRRQPSPPPPRREPERMIDPFIFQLSIFVLAIFVGYFVVWSVTPALHTPLMSVTNAISSVIVVGALLAVGAHLTADGNIASKIFGFFALILASVNIFGGFLVTQRMLAMYKKKG